MELSAVTAIIRRDVLEKFEHELQEGPNPQRYDVLSFDRLGRVSVYARK